LGFALATSWHQASARRFRSSKSVKLRAGRKFKGLSGEGTESAGGTAEQFSVFTWTEIDKWRRLVKTTNTKPDEYLVAP